MATLVLPAEKGTRPRIRSLDGISIAAYALLTFLLLGYHPYAEDGGIYSASIAARMDPSLFPLEHAWVTAHTAFALFVPAVALLFLTLHLSMEAGLLVLQIGSLFAMVYAVRSIARQCFGSELSAHSAMLAFAICAGLPVAGTSLYLVDPYVTARTITTPLLLWSLVFLVQNRYLPAAVFWIAAAMLHPLMAFWGGLTLLLFLIWRSERWAILFVCSGTLFVAAAVVLARSPADSAIVHTLAMSRAYWFLAQWHWYEVFGAIAPCAILIVLCAQRSAPLPPNARQIVAACCCASATALSLALCFARTTNHRSVIARCQPLRTLHLVFALFIVVASGWVGRSVPVLRYRWPTVGVIAVAAMGVFWMQLAVYPSSRHIEVPGLSSENDWMNAFQWIRRNTPKHAMFALDADYIAKQGEDAQGFRAATLRSVLPDRAKDGGIASVVPDLAADWRIGMEAQTGLDQDLSPSRIQRLRMLGVTWILIGPGAKPQLSCSYQNRTVAVCRLPE